MYEFVYDAYFFLFKARHFDVMYVLAGLPTPLLAVTRLLNRKLVIASNVDGLEWERSKYNWFERRLFRFFVECSLLFSHVVVLDAARMADHLPPRYREKFVTIPYGVTPSGPRPWDRSRLGKLAHTGAQRIEADDYWLVVARLQPDNNTHLIIDGYLRSGSKKLLVVVGDFWAEGYERKVRRILERDTEGRVVLVGGVYDRDLLDMLRQHCYGYIHGHSVGGTNPSLLEAMSAGNRIIAHANEFNQEVAQEGATFFEDAAALAEALRLQEAESNPRPPSMERARTRARDAYGWDAAVEAHESSFRTAVDMTAGRHRGRGA